eukprot:TRINITY_DN5174_c0_g1_i11.p2 TRINITY_DN5174_c0_g1~~TRINITY_DN5174_c0_g1_i11.p2  ORF type:complete len:217 (+),score=42.33 TRINITY_DN5174_c0_g1_i11:520-1170(+)
MVNVDGYLRIEEIFDKTGNLETIRKNRNPYTRSTVDSCIGVDLNRNYGFKFGIDDEGGSSDPCREEYRGPYAFSELETQAIRDFVLSHPTIKAAANLHSYGNSWIMPFSYVGNKENLEFSKQTSAYKIYEEIRLEGVKSVSAVFGNSVQTVRYPCNGEASDWMFAERNIIALSPELGSNKEESDDFFTAPSVIPEILRSTSFSCNSNLLQDRRTHT